MKEVDSSSILELRSGVYFMHDVNSEQKRRFVSGAFTEYNRMDLEDIAIISSGPRLLCLVLPRLANDIQWNLKLPTTSKHGRYNLIQSVNIIAERCHGLRKDAPMIQQLDKVEEEITIPFLTLFPRPIRLVGTCIIQFNIVS